MCSYGQDACEAAATALGLKLGGSTRATKFALSSRTENGCYSYESGSYKGMAFYGLRSDGTEQVDDSEFRPVKSPNIVFPELTLARD